MGKPIQNNGLYPVLSKTVLKELKKQVKQCWAKAVKDKLSDKISKEGQYPSQGIIICWKFKWKIARGAQPGENLNYKNFYFENMNHVIKITSFKSTLTWLDSFRYNERVITQPNEISKKF